jgi:hypothetical protein
VKDIAESRHNITVFIKVLIKAFDFSRSRVKATLAHWLYESGQRGKHIAADQDREEQILH